MPKKYNGFRECTEECKSKQHADELIAAISLTHSAVTDKQLAHFLKSRCWSYNTVQDHFGRNVLHIASSCGRKDLCRWLIKYSNVNVDNADAESTYTPLHRSLLFGYIDVAVSLIQLGANLFLTDRDDYSPTDLVQLDLELNLSKKILNLNGVERDDIDEFTCSKYNRRYPRFDVSYNGLCQVSSINYDALCATSNAFVTEVYTWGVNLNYTIGFGAESSKEYPEYLEFFEKKNEVIILICMQRYHTLFVSLSGNVWSCGLGHGGRLGLTFEDTVLIPQKVSLTSSQSRPSSGSPSTLVKNKSLFCVRAAVGVNHSIFMCNDNQVLTCGVNSYHQLGIVPPPTSVSVPQTIDIDLCKAQVAGVAASDFHSIVWTSNAVYSCGLHAGQLGHELSDEKTVPFFKRVKGIDCYHTCIVDVAVSESATVILTEMHNVLLLTGYKCQKFELRHIVTNLSTSLAELKRIRNLQNHIDCYSTESSVESISKIALHGGELDMEKLQSYVPSYRSEGLKMAVLMWEGSVYLWQEDANKFLRCKFLIKREFAVTDMTLSSIGMSLCTRKGEAYVASLDNIKITETFRRVSDGFTAVNQRNNDEDDKCYLVALKIINNAFRCVRIYSDPKGDNHAILQNRSVNALDNVPEMNTTTFTMDFESLYEESNEFDPFHDVVYQVGKKSFAAHKFVLASCCADCKLSKENSGTICVEKTHPAIFEQLLLFAYTGSCKLLQVGPCSIKIPKNVSNKHSSAKYDDPLKLAAKLASDFKSNKLLQLLLNFRYDNECIYLNSEVKNVPTTIRLRFNRLNCKHLYDIKLKSQDGRVFDAHKCIIVARMQYFRSMLCGNWMESSNTQYEHQLPVTGAVLNEMLEFVYTDTVTKTVHKKELTFWCSLLVAADQFILLKLREISENAIAQCLDTRNVCEILSLADVVRADQLKLACYEYICTNLSCMLHSRVLEKLDDPLLHKLTEFYRTDARFRNRNSLRHRSFPVYSTACNPADVINAEYTSRIDWDLNSSEWTDAYAEKKEPKKSIKVAARKKRARKCSSSEVECGEIRQSVANKEDVRNEIRTRSATIAKNETITNKDVKPSDEWIPVDRQLRLVASRLKVNAAVRDSPQLVEQKENYVPLSSNNFVSSTKSRVQIDTIEKSPPSPHYTLDIDFQNVSPRVSQNQMKRLQRTSESSKIKNKDVSLKNARDGNLTWPPLDECQSASSDCWGSKASSTNPISFSAIMASEKKQKTMIKKETKKIETKSLHLTQIEDKAIQELIALYGAANIDDECITVRRVIGDVALPQWVIK